MFVYLILYLTIFLLHPSVAHAWGPGTHLEIAFRLLEQSAIAAPAIRLVVAGREKWFLYGSVAADIVVGKKFAGEHHHCHNWDIGLKILKAARTDRERAAAYGYLAHLAADVVAHNYYIPYKIAENYRLRLLRHTYWETLFDLHVRPKVWDEILNMRDGDFTPFDRLLERVLTRAVFSFKTSKQIFSGILTVQRLKYFRKMAIAYTKKSRFKLDLSEIKHYMRLAFLSAAEYLKDPKGAKCLGGDPTGKKALKYAKTMRKILKKRSRQNSAREIAKNLLHVKDSLYKGMFGCSPFTQKS